MEDVHSATPALLLGTLFLTIWRTALFLCLSSETSLNIFFSRRTSTFSAFEVITETCYINYLLTYLLGGLLFEPVAEHLEANLSCSISWISQSHCVKCTYFVIITIKFHLVVYSVVWRRNTCSVDVISWRQRKMFLLRRLMNSNKGDEHFYFIFTSIKVKVQRSLCLYAANYRETNTYVQQLTTVNIYRLFFVNFCHIFSFFLHYFFFTSLLLLWTH